MRIAVTGCREAAPGGNGLSALGRTPQSLASSNKIARQTQETARGGLPRPALWYIKKVAANLRLRTIRPICPRFVDLAPGLEKASTGGAEGDSPLTSKIEAGRAWAVFLLAASAFTLSMFFRTSAAVISPQLSEELGLDSAQLGTLSAVFFYAFAACQIPLVLILDRAGARATMLVLSAVGICGALVFAWAHTPIMAIVGRAMLGVGMSANLMGPMALLAAWFRPAVFATLSGLLMALGNAGGMLSGTPLVWLTLTVGWRYTFVIMAGMNLLLALGLLVLVRDRPADRPRPPAPAGGMFGGIRLLAASPSYWAISLASFFRYGCIMALQGLWVGPWVIYGLGLSQMQSGNANLLLALSQVIGLPLCGLLSDRVFGSRKWVSLPALVAAAALIWSMQWLDRGSSPWLVYGFCLLVGLMSSPGQILYVHIKELMPPESAGAAMTGINLFTMLGPAILMQVAGLLVGAEPAALTGSEGFSPAWILMSAGLALSALVYAFVPDSKALKSGE